MKVHPDGRRAISGDDNGIAKVWDLESGTCIQTLEAHDGSIFALDLLPDGERIVTAGKDCSVRIWDLASGRMIAYWAAEIQFMACAATDRGRIVLGGADGRVRFLDVIVPNGGQAFRIGRVRDFLG